MEGIRTVYKVQCTGRCGKWMKLISTLSGKAEAIEVIETEATEFHTMHDAMQAVMAVGWGCEKYSRPEISPSAYSHRPVCCPMCRQNEGGVILVKAGQPVRSP